MKKFNKLLIACLAIVAMSGSALATEAGYYDKDVTPPWAKLTVKGSVSINGVSYVNSEEATIDIYAKDDKCFDDEIKYYMSTTPILDVGKIAPEDWKPYSVGATEMINISNSNSPNVVYAVFKDKNGNTSQIYTGSVYEQTVEYNMNTTDEVYFTGSVSDKRYYGAPYIITSQVPKREGYYFLGWSTSPSSEASYYAGDIVPAEVAIGTEETKATLYAVWSTDVTKLPLLADMVNIGDYVDYPVVYDNVVSYTNGSDTSYVSPYEGWRVIGKEADGTVNLVSAGCPLSFYNYTNQAKSIPALTTNFLTTPFSGSDAATYRKTGFTPYLTLTETFTNKFTQTDSSTGLPKVRSMVQEDIFKVTGHTEMLSAYEMGLDDKKYANLFYNKGYYWLASPYPADTSRLWHVHDYGRVANHNGYEFGVRPVVSLKPDVRAAGKDMSDAWNISMVEEAQEPDIEYCTITFDVYYLGLLSESVNIEPVMVVKGSKYTMENIQVNTIVGLCDVENYRINGEIFYKGDVITIMEDTKIDVFVSRADPEIEGDPF